MLGLASFKYYDIDEMHNIEIPHNNKSLSLFHINTSSLNKYFDDLQHLLCCTQKNFDMITISKTRITKNITSLNNLNLNNYSFEFTPTQTSAGGTLLYIADHLSYTLIDNIFSNVIDPDIISGNLTTTISDHLLQFAIIPNTFGNILGNK